MYKLQVLKEYKAYSILVSLESEEKHLDILKNDDGKIHAANRESKMLIFKMAVESGKSFEKVLEEISDLIYE